MGQPEYNLVGSKSVDVFNINHARLPVQDTIRHDPEAWTWTTVPARGKMLYLYKRPRKQGIEVNDRLVGQPDDRDADGSEAKNLALNA